MLFRQYNNTIFWLSGSANALSIEILKPFTVKPNINVKEIHWEKYSLNKSLVKTLLYVSYSIHRL